MDSALVVAIVFISIALLMERVFSRRTLSKERIKMIERGGEIKDLNLSPKNTFS